jgi:hypothetical protein
MLYKHIYIAIFLLLPGSIYAQQQLSSASAGVSATISTPISVSKSVSMSFSNISVSPTQGGSIILDPTGKESTSGGVSITNSQVGAPASFTVSGQGGYAYSVNLPTAPVSIDDSSANLLNITTFTSSPPVSGESQSGTQTINVGATLNLEKAEEAGEFEAEIPFDIQVNYN